MSRFALDTSCLVAAACSWHDHHEATIADLDSRLDAGATPVSLAPVLVESYAVLTRLPLPHRLSPGDAHELLGPVFGNRD